MSRRARRRNGSGGNAGNFAKLAGVAIAIGLLAAAVLYAGVRRYLHSESFRQLLSEKVSSSAGVSGEFTPFRWDGLAVETDAFTAQGDGPVRSMRFDGLHTEVVLGGLRRGVWELRDSRARRLEISIDTRDTDASPVAAAAAMSQAAETPVKAKSRSGWLPREVDVQGIELNELKVDAITPAGSFIAQGIRMDVEKSGSAKSRRMVLSGGTLRMPYRHTPEIRLDGARLQSQPGAVFLTSLQASAWSAARLEASGEWDQATRALAIDGRVSGVKCEEVLNEDWSRRLTGEFSSDFVIRQESDRTTAKGHLVLEKGVLTALPVLDVLAAYADTRRFRVLVLSEAHADWTWRNDVLEFSNIVIASESLVRLEGRLSIRGEQLDGDLRLGLAPGTLATIPGAETHVFMPGERGLLWAPLRLTGTFDKPREDLSDRLIAAAGLRILETLPETGEKVLKFSRTVLTQESQKAVEKGVKIIEEGSQTVREVSGLLEGILGTGRRREPEPPPPTKPAEP
jgi:hypothetical protein